MNKTYPSAVDALRDILKDGQKLAVGGFWPLRHSRDFDPGGERFRRSEFNRNCQ